MPLGVVLAGGESTEQLVPRALRVPGAMDDAFVVAADSGLDLAERLGLVPSLVVGDLDSVSAGALARARVGGVEVQQHPTAKDSTDLQLAMAAAVAAGVDRVVVLGGAGGRLDHLLANVGLVADPGHGVPVEGWFGRQYVAAVAGSWRAELGTGCTVSVLAIDGDAVASERGMRWDLHRHRLPFGSTLGVSNEALGGEVEITVHEGRVVVVLPDAEDLT